VRFLWGGSVFQGFGRLGEEKILLEELPEQGLSGKDKGKASRSPVEEVRDETQILRPAILQLRQLGTRLELSWVWISTPTDDK
jgi:hypothetical protein